MSCCSEEKKEKNNPFLPYEEALWVRHLSPTHTLLLNKFNVVAHHLICVTREFEQQTQPLTAADLEATWTAMQVLCDTSPAPFCCGARLVWLCEHALSMLPLQVWHVM